MPNYFNSHYKNIDLFYDQLDESTKWDTVFKTIYKLVVKNYFLEVEEGVNGAYGKAQLAGLKKKAEQAVTGDKETASCNVIGNRVIKINVFFANGIYFTRSQRWCRCQPICCRCQPIC